MPNENIQIVADGWQIASDKYDWYHFNLGD